MRFRLHVLTAAIVACASSGCAPAGTSNTDLAGPTAGKVPEPLRAPLATLGGSTTNLARLTRGRVAVLALWATWCEGCKREVDALVRLDAAARRRSDVVVVGIAVGDSALDVAAFVREHRVTYDQLVDEDFRFADAIGERRVPTTLVLDRAGRIRHRGDALDGAALAALRIVLENGE